MLVRTQFTSLGPLNVCAGVAQVALRRRFFSNFFEHLPQAQELEDAIESSCELAQGKLL